jgi:hypothetical protein
MVTGPTGPKPPAGPGTPVPTPAKVPLTKDKVTVPVTLPSGKTILATARNPMMNLIERAGKTLAQTFLSTFVVVFFGAQKMGVDALKAAAAAGGSAVIAAALSLVSTAFGMKGAKA